MYYIIKQRFSFTVRRLSLCQDLDHSSCGDVLFHGSLGPPCKLYNIKSNTFLFIVNTYLYSALSRNKEKTC